MADDGKPTSLSLCGNIWYYANKFAYFHTSPHRLRLCHHPTKEYIRGAHLRCGCADFRDIYCSTCGLRCKVSARVCDLWSLHFDPGFEYLGEDCRFSLLLCGFVRVGSGVVQRVAARQTCLRVNKCAELLRNDENILKSSAQTSLADALNLSSKPSVFSAHSFSLRSALACWRRSTRLRVLGRGL